MPVSFLHTLIATLENRPAFTSWDFLQWRRSIVTAKSAPARWEPQTVYYVSESEGDDMNDGSELNPWQTIAKVQSIIDGLGSGTKTVFRFKRGDTWEETGTGTGTNGSSCLLDVSQSHIGIEAWGAGQKPFFNRFVNKHSSGWTVSSGDVYVKNVSEDVAWARLESDRLTPFFEATDAADCATNVAETSGSFFFDNATGDLFVNLGGTDPNTVTIETAESNDEAIEIKGNGCFLRNIRLDGAGIHRTAGATQGGIRMSNGNLDTCLFEWCEMYFGSSHAIHHNRFTGSGGIAVMIGCVAGFSKYNGTAGTTLFNSYAQLGNQEAFLQDCECPFGTLPSHEWHNPNDADGTKLEGAGFYSHTAGGGATTGFILVDGLKCDHDNPWGPNDGAYGGNPPSAATLEDAKFVVFNESWFNSRKGMRIFRLSPTHGVKLCSKMIGGYGADWATRAISNVPQYGWLINSVIDVTHPSALANAHGVFNGNSNSNAKWYFNRIIQRPENANHDLLINYDGGTTWQNGDLANNVFARIGTYDLSRNVTTGSVPADNNAFWNWKTGDKGTNSTDISTEAEALEDSSNDPGNDTYEAANTAVGIVPEYDRLLNRRAALTSIGDLA